MMGDLMTLVPMIGGLLLVNGVMALTRRYQARQDRRYMAPHNVCWIAPRDPRERHLALLRELAVPIEDVIAEAERRGEREWREEHGLPVQLDEVNEWYPPATIIGRTTSTLCDGHRRALGTPANPSTPGGRY